MKFKKQMNDLRQLELSGKMLEEITFHYLLKLQMFLSSSKTLAKLLHLAKEIFPLKNLLQWVLLITLFSTEWNKVMIAM